MIKNLIRKSSLLLLLVATFFLLITNNTPNSKVDVVKEAEAATITGGIPFYLKPNSNWKQSNAWFSAYFFTTANNNTAWSTMSDPDGDGIYSCLSPSGSWTNIIFVRMDPAGSIGSWDYDWNQTNDLTYDGTKNLYTVTEGAWSKGSGSWSAQTTNTVQLKPNSNWIADGARFAIYLWDAGEHNKWYSMSKVTNSNDIYSVNIYPGFNFIFVRMDGSKATNSWDNDWNQSTTVTIKPGSSNNCYKITSGQWGDGNSGATGSWTVTKNTVFNSNYQNGTANTTQTIIDVSNSSLSPTQPTAETNYVFNGWGTSANATTPTTPKADGTTYYAIWHVKTTFDYNYTNAPADSIITQYPNTTITISNPTRNNYVFQGWNSASDGSGNAFGGKADGKTYYAQWHIITSFDWNYDGGLIEAIVAEEDSTITSQVTALEQPARDGYSFAGWYDAPSDGNKVEAFLADGSTYYAYWYVDTTFVWNYPTAPQNTVVSQFEGTVINLDIPSRNATFAGWYNNSSDGELIYGPSDDILADGETYYAYWTCTTTFNSNMDGISNQEIVELEGKEIIPAIIYKPGKEFIGWYLDGEGDRQNSFISNGSNYEAKWVDAPSFVNTELILQYYYSSAVTETPTILKAGMKFNAVISNTAYNNYVNSEYTYILQIKDSEDNILDEQIMEKSIVDNVLYTNSIYRLEISEYINLNFNVVVVIKDSLNNTIFEDIGLKYSIDTLSDQYIINHLNGSNELSLHDYSIIYSLHKQIGHDRAGSLEYDTNYHWCDCTVCQTELDKTPHDISGSFSFNPTQHWKDCKSCEYNEEVEEHYYENRILEEYKISGFTCDSPEIYYKSCACGSSAETNPNLTYEEKIFENGEALGHDYSAVFNWSGDYETAQVVLTCSRSNEHGSTKPATVTKVTTPATCEVAGNIEYTATYTYNGKTFTDVRNKVLPAIGHNYAGTYTWNGYSSATLNLTCSNDNSHKYTTTVNSTVKSTTNATCTADGSRVHQVTYTYNGKTYTDTKTETLNKLGHVEANGGEAAIHTKCSRCGITLSSTHSYSTSVAIAATCTAKGTTRYTCSCGYSYTIQDIEINASNHSGKVVNGGTSAVHTKYDCCGVTVSSTHSYTKTTQTAATCTTKGTSKYTCGCGYSYTSQDIPINSSNHNYTGSYWNGKIYVGKCSRCGVYNTTGTSGTVVSGVNLNNQVSKGVACNMIHTVNFKGTIQAPLSSSISQPQIGTRIEFSTGAKSGDYLFIYIYWTPGGSNEATGVKITGTMNSKTVSATYSLSGCGITPESGGSLIVTRFNDTIKIQVKKSGSLVTIKDSNGSNGATSKTYTISQYQSGALPEASGGNAASNNLTDIYDTYNVKIYGLNENWENSTSVFQFDGNTLGDNNLSNDTVKRENYVLMTGFTGDYTLKFDYKGASSNPANAQVGAHMWWLGTDGNNYCEMYVAWHGTDSNATRKNQVYHMITQGKLDGQATTYDQRWGDQKANTNWGNETTSYYSGTAKPNEGGTISIYKSGFAFTSELWVPNVSNAKYYRRGYYDFSAAYHESNGTAMNFSTKYGSSAYTIILYANGDTFTISNITFTTH